jgi:glucose/arabinose dehydrogenase
MRHVLLGLVLLALVGCSVGPAANRAGHVGTRQPSPSWSQTSQPPDTRREPTPSPRTELPPAEGSVSVTGELAVPRLRGTACCLAELTGGDLLVGVRETGQLYRVAVDAGIAAEVGEISGVALGEGQYRLIDVAVPPDAGNEVDLYAYYAQGDSGAEIGRYGYDPHAPEWQEPVSWSPWTIADNLPTPADALGSLAFGPDGMVYASRGGDVLRLEDDGEVPDGNPAGGSLVYAAGYGDIAGIAWDAAGRAWSLDAATGAVRAVIPGALDGAASVLAEVDDPSQGLAYAAGSLWIGTGADGGGLWRLPLDGTELVAAPALLPLTGTSAADVVDVLPADGGGLWLLTGDGRILRVGVR